ncbi:uncharacterized protein LAJ45_08128 [Morchella importuna]|uniref:cAMP-dependent protein kinase n=1 Tax=Morchella conica CCBAS932 TaxID=1392247 RepID=A0A3N4KIU2_9PEZI|nr:uncharacterized protein LAJ45_08128 [Morchella importuna]KAH8147664.1 hypothetical protein LAJ45_08128 [Morchella importuna]RPB10477.1 kinase-like protein [Morchella conica CCBAS932]
MHRGPSNLPTPPPDSITEEERSKPGLKFDSGMDIDFQSDSLHSPVSSAQPPVSQLESTISTTTAQADFKEEMKNDSEWRKPSVDDFDFMTTLGTGTFARVWLVKPRSVPNSGEAPLFALKQLKKSDIVRLKQCEHVRNERAILEVCRPHPFITHYLCSWQDRNSLYILLEYSPGGEIFGYLRRARRFDFATTQFYAAEIAMILVFLHSHGIVYRDLKPENILLDARGHVKLVDFGFAKVVGDRETYTLCGTPEYLSPEVIQSKGHGKAVDWWALGVLIYEMSCGFPPFYDNSPFAIYEKIVAGRISFPSLVPEETKDIVRKLCTKDLSARLGNMRGGGHQVMAHRFFDGIDWQELESQVNPGPIIPHLRFAGDTRYFDHYEPPAPTTDDEYPKEMMDKYDIQFRDF